MSVYCATKTAMTMRLRVMLTEQAPEPEQAPPVQWLKR